MCLVPCLDKGHPEDLAHGPAEWTRRCGKSQGSLRAPSQVPSPHTLSVGHSVYFCCCDKYLVKAISSRREVYFGLRSEGAACHHRVAQVEEGAAVGHTADSILQNNTAMWRGSLSERDLEHLTDVLDTCLLHSGSCQTDNQY